MASARTGLVPVMPLFMCSPAMTEVRVCKLVHGEPSVEMRRIQNYVDTAVLSVYRGNV